MHKLRLIAFLLLAMALQPLAQAEEDFLEPDAAFKLSLLSQKDNQLQLEWTIAPGYYLYKNKISFRSEEAGVEIASPQLPAAEIKHDQFFGDVEVYRGRLVVGLSIKTQSDANKAFTLIAKSQGCADAGLCYPPHEQKLAINLPANSQGPKKPNQLPSLTALGNHNANDEILPVEQAFMVSAQLISDQQLRLDWRIAPGTYLYQDRIKVSLAPVGGLSLGAWQLPAPKIKQNAIRPDGTEGDLAVYDQDFSIEIPLQLTEQGPVQAQLQVSYQGCAEAGICYPPQQQSIPITLPSKVSGPTVSAQENATPAITEPASEQDRIAGLLQHGNLWLILVSFFGVGILLAFTPCVFPMIPILSGIIAGQGERITTRKAFALSLVYVLAMALTYTLAGVLAGLFGENLQASFQNPWIIGTFSLVFVLLALSMFGFFELQLPSSLQSRLSEASNRQQGGSYVGVAIMGLLSALIVGPCVAPPLAGALIYIGQTGDAVLGGLALFAMSLGMGAPLIALGTGAGHLLPRAGAWMNTVKAVFGVAMLAVALLLLERILPTTVTMLFWGLLLVCVGVYLGALESIPQTNQGWRKFWKGIGISLLIYGGLMLMGVAAGGNDTLQPLRGLALGSAGSGAQEKRVSFQRIKTIEDLHQALQIAQQQNKAVMLDFYADWCTYCIQFEKYVFSDPKVSAALQPFSILQADVTNNDVQDKALLAHLSITAPPAILFWGPNGKEQKPMRILGYMAADAFFEHLGKLTQ